MIEGSTQAEIQETKPIVPKNPPKTHLRKLLLNYGSVKEHQLKLSFISSMH
jgi:hypothetical protein